MVNALATAAREDPAPTVRVACIKTLLRVGVSREVYAGTLQTMHEDIEGRAILGTAGISRFSEISDEDYHPIREMDRVAAAVKW